MESQIFPRIHFTLEAIILCNTSGIMHTHTKWKKIENTVLFTYLDNKKKYSACLSDEDTGCSSNWQDSSDKIPQSTLSTVQVQFH